MATRKTIEAIVDEFAHQANRELFSITDNTPNRAARLRYCRASVWQQAARLIYEITSEEKA